MSPGASFRHPAAASTPGTTTSDDGGTSSLWIRANTFEQADKERLNFIQELIWRYEYISQQYQELCESRQLENEMANQWKHDKQQYEDHIRTLQICLERDPFVLVLIDGDGMIFDNELIKAGEAGGRKAASLLHANILNYIQREAPNVPMDAKIVCRIYANVRGLADVLVRAGVCETIETVEQFTHGFTRGKTLFDFVDVGAGKDRADEKINETFKLYLSDFHCRHIFFGCSHDNGYARTLEDNATDQVCLERVTLLEGVPFEKELLALPFPTKKFPGVFREAKLNVWGTFSSTVTNGASKNYNILTGLPSRLPPPPKHGVLDSPIPAHVMPNIPRSPSTSTLASNEGIALAVKTTPFMSSWAAKAAAPAPIGTASSSPVNKTELSEETIARNRAGQRVDQNCRDYDKAEVDRIKKIKMCNVHFLRKECPYGEKCTHVHDYNPTPDEIRTLRLVARMAPCIHGSGCSDFKCIYGHKCPAPPSKKPVKGGKTCIFGDSCKFPPELHDLDTAIVKTMVVR